MPNSSLCRYVLFLFTFFTSFILDNVLAVKLAKSQDFPDHRGLQNRVGVAKRKSSSCFPALDFDMPDDVPSSLTNWWCDAEEEYAFMGFSYEVTECQSRKKLKREFKDIRNTFDGRYVRMYGACDRDGFYNDVIDAAWEAGVGVHALIWFGFDGTDEWQTRRDNLLDTLLSNPKAPFVTRAVQFGSEPLFDWVLDPLTLATEIWSFKALMAPLYIPVTISEMAYGYQAQDEAQPVLDAVDIIDAHMLPFFSQEAGLAEDSWPLVLEDLKWFKKHGEGKKVYLSQNGWPSETYSGVEANSAAAVADVPNEKNYFKLLDSKCSHFKKISVGWFAHIYSDNQEPGYGIYDVDGNLKFKFNPQTEC